MQDPHPRDRRQSGFTLIEIMAVVIIIGLLSGMVGLAVFGQVDDARRNTARTQMRTLENALDLYKMDNARYPTTEQGLQALVTRPSSPPEPRRYPADGYLKGGEVPLDPWNEPFQYLSPGQHNSRGYDICSFGADGSPGGADNDADICNWGDQQT